MVMTKANILEVKTRLSEYVERAAGGERVVICRHNRPVAELRAVEASRADPRPIGPLPGRPTFEIPASFFEPMAEEELALWEGGRSAEPLPPEWAPGPQRKRSKAVRRKRQSRTPSARRQGRRRP